MAAKVLVIHTRRSPCLCHEAWLDLLSRLGHAGRAVPVEDMEGVRGAVAWAHLVVDHTDTFEGSGELRAGVRDRLESWGARLVGTTAAAARACDDKIAARGILEAAGVPVAPGWVVRGRELGSREAPRERVVVKRPFDHGSRGIHFVRDAAGWERAVRALADHDGPVLVERWIEGRELAVGVVEDAGGPAVLPAVAIPLKRGETFSRSRKWLGSLRPRLEDARLKARERERVEEAARRAFGALGLRDYGRFDLRLPDDGEPRFLEANARPSFERGMELRFAARLAGMDGPALAAAILASAARRHGLALR